MCLSFNVAVAHVRTNTQHRHVISSLPRFKQEKIYQYVSSCAPDTSHPRKTLGFRLIYFVLCSPSGVIAPRTSHPPKLYNIMASLNRSIRSQQTSSFTHARAFVFVRPMRVWSCYFARRSHTAIERRTFYRRVLVVAAARMPGSCSATRRWCWRKRCTTHSSRSTRRRASWKKAGFRRQPGAVEDVPTDITAFHTQYRYSRRTRNGQTRLTRNFTHALKNKLCAYLPLRHSRVSVGAPVRVVVR